MGRTLSLIRALAFATPGLLLAASGEASDRSAPMHFEMHRLGSSEVCGKSCKTIVAASGVITADTPRQFREFARRRNLSGATVVFESDGGSVHGAIALGREIRRLGLDTTVGHVADVKRFGENSYATIASRADCESMCAFVLLSGVNRLVPADARVMVHQIWLGDRREDPTAANYSAEDLVLVQQDIGRLAQFTMEMGVPIDMLDLSLRIPPWEPMHAMTREELRRMHVVTNEPAVPADSNAVIAKDPPASLTQPVIDGQSVTEISERRWAMIDRSGAMTLARRHPLTIEGEDIGNFDLFVSCGMGDTYDVSYVERRRSADSVPLPNKLSDVRLQAAGREASLKVVSSERHDRSDELVTYANGSVPVSIVESFAAVGSHSLTIKTTSVTKLVTGIRIGNTGVSQSLPMLASRCVKSLGNRAELEMPKKGD
jgi:hypothetical protein